VASVFGMGGAWLGLPEAIAASAGGCRGLLVLLDGRRGRGGVNTVGDVEGHWCGLMGIVPASAGHS
jgi:hypothetical protein